MKIKTTINFDETVEVICSNSAIPYIIFDKDLNIVYAKIHNLFANENCADESLNHLLDEILVAEIKNLLAHCTAPNTLIKAPVKKIKLEGHYKYILLGAALLQNEHTTDNFFVQFEEIKIDESIFSSSEQVTVVPNVQENNTDVNAKLPDTEIRYKAMIETSINAIFLMTIDGKIIELNDAACDLFGYNREELLGDGRAKVIDFSDGRAQALLAQRKLNGNARGEITGIRKDGTKIELDYVSAVFTDSKGGQMAYSMMNDISERKMVEYEMQLMLNSTEESFVLVDKHFTIISFNKKFEIISSEYLGVKVEKGKNIISYAYPQYQDKLQKLLIDVLGGEQKKSVFKIPLKNNEHIFFSMNYNPVMDADKKSIGIFITGVDVTLEKIAEEKLLERQKRVEQAEKNYREIFEKANDAILIIDPETLTVVDCNVNANTIFNKQCKDLIGNGLAIFQSYGNEFTAVKFESNLLIAKNGNSILFEWKLDNETVTNYWVEISLQYAEVSNSKRVIAFIREINDRKKSEYQTQIERNNNEALINNTEDLFWSVDRNFKLITCNEAYRKVISKSGAFNVQPGDYLLNSLFGTAQNNKWKQLFTRGLNGEKFTINDSIHKPFHETIQYFILSFNPIRNEEGVVTGVACYSKNITDLTLKQLTIEAAHAELENIMTGSLDMICTIGNDHIIKRVSAASMKILGYEPAEMVGKYLFSFIHADDAEKTIARTNEVINGKASNNFYNRYIHKNGTIVFLEWASMRDEKNSVRYAIARDVSEKIKTENQLKLSEQRFKSLVQDAMDMISIIDKDNNFKYVSPSFANIVGYKQDELIGKSPMQFMHKDDFENTKLAFQQLKTSQKVLLPHFRVKHKNGEWVWIETTVTNLIKEGAVNGIVANARDITARKKNENELRFSTEKYKYLFDNSPAPMLIYDKESLAIIDCNEAYLLKYKYTKNELLKLDTKHLFGKHSFRNSFITNPVYFQTTYKQIYKHQKKDGETLFVDCSAQLIHEGGNQRWLVMVIDITQRLTAEKQKEDDRRNTEALINSTKDLIWSISSRNNLIAANKPFIELLHAEIGVHINVGDDILKEGTLPVKFNQFWQRLYKRSLDGERYSKEVFLNEKTTGALVWYEINFNPIYSNAGIVGVACYARNITEVKNNSELIKSSEEKYRLVFNISPLPKLIFDLETLDILDVNNAAVYTYGYSKNEFLGLNLKHLRLEKNLGILYENQKKAKDARGIIEFGICAHINKKGDPLQLKISGNILTYQNRNCMMVVCLDVTERELMLETLLDRESKLLEAQKIGKMGYWQYDINTKAIFWSQQVFEIWNINESVKLTLEKIAESIDVNDRSFFKQAFEKTVEDKVDLDIQFRIIAKDKTVKWIHQKGKVIRDENNNPVSINGTTQDITEHQNITEKLAESNQRFQYVSKATFDAIWDWDLVTNQLYLGEGFSVLFGEDLTNSYRNVNSWFKNIHEDERDAVYKNIYDVIKNKNINNWIKEYKYKKVDGSFADVIDKGIVVRDAEGEAIRMIGAMQDISQQRMEEQRLQLMNSVVTNANDAIVITNHINETTPELTIIFCNEAFCKMTGYNEDEVIGKSPKLLQGLNTDKEEINKIKIAIDKLEPCEVTTINYKKNGEQFWVNFTMSPIINEKGICTNWIAVERDVTVRKNEELQKILLSKISIIFNEEISINKTLEKVLEHLCTFSNFSIGEAWIIGADGKTMYRSSSYAETVEMKAVLDETDNYRHFKKGEGFPGLAWETKEVQQWFSGADNPLFLRKETVEKMGLKRVYGVPLIHNNEVISVFVLGTTDEKYLLHHFENTASKISNYIGPELKRKLLEQELNQLFNNAPDIIAIISLDSFFKKINPAGVALLEYTESELMADPLTNFIFENDKQHTLAHCKELAKKNQTVYFENRFISKTGKIKWLAWTCTSSLDARVIFGVAKDITDKKELESLLSKATTLAKIGGWEYDLVNNSLFWSDITKELHEVGLDYVPSYEKAITFYKDATNKELIETLIKDAIAFGKPYDAELHIITAKGNLKWVRAIGDAEFVNGKCVRLYGSFQDINERKTSQEHIRSSEERRQLIMTGALDAILCIDKFGVTTFWNPQAAQIFGYSEKEVLGKEIVSLVVPDRFKTRNQIGLKNYLETGKRPAFNKLLQLSAIKRSGEEFPIELTILPLEQNGEEFFCAFIRDITERKRSELKLLELNSNLQKQATELAASNHELEQFAYVASHDLQEPLRMVTSFLTQLEKKYEPVLDEKGKKYIYYAVDGATRMRQIILDLLDFSRVGRTDEEKEIINLNEIISEIKILFSQNIQEINAEINADLPLTINYYRSPVRNIFQNLISNALKYCKPGIPTKISIKIEDFENDWCFAVTDNGIGINKNYFDKIFIIFQRLHTNEVYAGTGMGLAVTKKIIENLNGKIWVESEEGIGSTFYFTIPKINFIP